MFRCRYTGPGLITSFSTKLKKKTDVQDSGPHHAQAAHNDHSEPGPIKSVASYPLDIEARFNRSWILLNYFLFLRYGEIIFFLFSTRKPFVEIMNFPLEIVCGLALLDLSLSKPVMCIAVALGLCNASVVFLRFVSKLNLRYMLNSIFLEHCFKCMQIQIIV